MSAKAFACHYCGMPPKRTTVVKHVDATDCPPRRQRKQNTYFQAFAATNFLQLRQPAVERSFLVLQFVDTSPAFPVYPGASSTISPAKTIVDTRIVPDFFSPSSQRTLSLY